MRQRVQESLLERPFTGVGNQQARDFLPSLRGSATPTGVWTKKGNAFEMEDFLYNTTIVGL